MQQIEAPLFLANGQRQSPSNNNLWSLKGSNQISIISSGKVKSFRFTFISQVSLVAGKFHKVRKQQKLSLSGQISVLWVLVPNDQKE